MLTLLLLPLSAQAQTAPTALAGILDAPGPAVAASFAPSSHGPYPYWNKVLTASTTGSPTTLLTGAPKQSVPIDCSNSPSCDAGLEVGMCLQAIPPSECDLLCEKSGIFCADDFEFRNDGSHHNAGATKACAKGTVVGEVCSQAAGMTGAERGEPRGSAGNAPPQRLAGADAAGARNALHAAVLCPSMARCDARAALARPSGRVHDGGYHARNFQCSRLSG